MLARLEQLSGARTLHVAPLEPDATREVLRQLLEAAGAQPRPTTRAAG